MSNKNMTPKELVKEESISISFVNGQITDIRGTGYVPSDITDDFTGTLIYKNNELSKVIGFGHLGKSTNNNTLITGTTTSTTFLCTEFIPDGFNSPNQKCMKCGKYSHQHPNVSYTQ